MSYELTTDEMSALRSVEGGADVYSMDLAMRLREIEKKAPELLTICEPQAYEGDGTDQMPYFGCIVTAAGKKALRFP